MTWTECIQQNILINAQRALREAQAAGDEEWIAKIQASTPSLLNFVGGDSNLATNRKPSGREGYNEGQK